jgi:hypothetical protein
LALHQVRWWNPPTAGTGTPRMAEFEVWIRLQYHVPLLLLLVLLLLT